VTSAGTRIGRIGLASLAAAALLVGCAKPEILLGRPAEVPVGVDLSGMWQLRADDSDGARRMRAAIRATDGVDDREIFSGPDRQQSGYGTRRSDRRVKGGLVHVFLETGKSLKVTQTQFGLFISFDRAIVEEFRFGENRMINVGEVQAQRVTGWEGEVLVVETLDRNRMKLTERIRLVDNGAGLERRIILRSAKGEEETLIQRFDRQSD
jgi:hypothetical protein